MKAFGVKKWAESYSNASEALEEVSLAIPEVTGRDLLVEVKAVATNPVDLKKVNNFGNPSEDFPSEGLIVPGWDACGIVKATGPETKLFKSGDTVMFAGSILRPGCFSQFVLVDERVVGKKPNSLCYADAAALPLTTLTAWESLIELARIPINPTGEKKTLLITAGAGGVGSIAIQIAKQILHLDTIVATASRAETGEWCRKLGASHIVNHHMPLKAQLVEQGISGIDVVFHCSDLSVDSFDQFVDICNPMGHIVFITTNGESLPIQKMTMKRISLSGEIMYSRGIFGYGMEEQHRILNTIADFVDSGVIVTHANTKYPFTLEGLKAAFDMQGSGKTLGKNVCSNEE